MDGHNDTFNIALDIQLQIGYLSKWGKRTQDYAINT